jgi:XTP/dITP diphosphohydrolase
MKIRFVSKNEHKVKEVQKILSDVGVEVVAAKHSINEIQTEDVNSLVKDKLLKAFKIIGRPVFVEHTGLYIESLNEFPGGLTQIFWDKLQADKFSTLLGSGDDTNLIAKTIIGYCDSKKVHLFVGCISGSIAPKPRGNRDFQWDCIFIPEGETKTFAEMGSRKNEISMRKIAFDQFKKFLSEENK